MFEFEACEVFKIKEFTFVNDCFKDEHKEEIGHYGQARNRMIAKLKSINNVRWIRMGIGLFFFFMGIGEKRWGVSLIGAFIFTQGIMDWGCGFRKDSCGTMNTEVSDSVKFDSKKSIRKLE